jgi:DNA repair protein RadA/Sms
MTTGKGAPAPGQEARATKSTNSRCSHSSPPPRLGQALELLELGLRPLPVQPGKKTPRVPWKAYQMAAPLADEVDAWWTRWPDSEIALITGHDGGLDCLDLDVDADGKVAAWPSSSDQVKPTACVIQTPRGGLHYLFQHIPGCRNSAGLIAPHVDVRGEGGLVVVTGKGREIVQGGSLLDALKDSLQTPAPAWLKAALLSTNTPQKPTAEPVGDVIPGRRNSVLASLAGSMRRRGLSPDAITAALQVENRSRCRPPLSDVEVCAIAESVGRYPPEEDATTAHLARLVSLDNIDAEDVRWLWQGYIPSRKLTLVAGDPGAGKTFVTLDLIARLSKGGRWPDGSSSPGPANVLLLTYEDGVADTIRPRLDAANADLSRVFVVEDLVPTIENHALHALLERVRPALLAIDPLNGFLGVDTNRSHEVRPLLQRLARIAETYNCAILACHHLNKTGSGSGLSPLYRLLGSIEFGAVARSIHAVSRDRDGDRRVFAPIKSSLAPEQTAHAFDLTAGKVRWLGPTDDRADDSMDPEEGSALREAVEFLTAALADGAVPSADVLKDAAKQGINDKTLRRAKTRLGIESRKIDNVWTWSKT